MTPNPHPASWNGDVIERAQYIIENLIAPDVYLRPEADGNSVANAAKIIAKTLAAAGLLKLSEGSGDGKMREALSQCREFIDGWLQTTKLTADDAEYQEFFAIKCLIDEALATSVPAKKRVHVKTSSYEVDGTEVARFKTTKGADRVVVEFDTPQGMLHIHNPDQLSKTATTSPKCRGKYCWNAGDPDSTGSFSRCEECPDRPVDAAVHPPLKGEIVNGIG